MSHNGLLVIDSDFHVIEPPDLWERYLSAEWRDQAPVGSTSWPRATSA